MIKDKPCYISPKLLFLKNIFIGLQANTLAVNELLPFLSKAKCSFCTIKVA